MDSKRESLIALKQRLFSNAGVVIVPVIVMGLYNTILVLPIERWRYNLAAYFVR